MTVTLTPERNDKVSRLLPACVKRIVLLCYNIKFSYNDIDSSDGEPAFIIRIYPSKVYFVA